MTNESELSGVIPRVSAVLTQISHAGAVGARLVDLANGTGIARPTVHRMLKDLIQAGMVLQTTTRTYILGPQLYWLGLTAQPPLRNMPAIRNIAQSLAKETGDTVYVAIRQQTGVRYVLRAEGDFPIRTHAVSVGDLKAFTTSYSGIALMAAFEDETINAILQSIVVDAPGQWASRQSPELAMRRAIDEVRAHGWCHISGVVMPGIAGLTAPVPGEGPLPLAAISVTSIESRLPRELAETLAPSVLAAASSIAAHI